MPIAERHLYRGTSRGWPGNPQLQHLRKTPATTDPLVATLFALECCRHGSGIVYIGEVQSFAEFVDAGNVLAAQESEIVVNVTPLEFAHNWSVRELAAEAAREILLHLGISVPETIRDRWRLGEYLKEFARLSATQIEEFDRHALG